MNLAAIFHGNSRFSSIASSSRSFLTPTRHERLLESGRNLFRRPDIIRVPSDRDQLFHQRLAVRGLESLKVCQDEHVFSRLVSFLIFGTENDYNLMRACIYLQIKSNRALYDSSLVDGGFESFCRKLESGRESDREFIKAACELFRVTFRELLDGDMCVVREFAPRTIEGCMNERNVFPRKILWFSSRDTWGIQPLRPLTPRMQDIVVPELNFKLYLLRSNMDNFDNSARNSAEMIEICKNFFSHLPTFFVPNDDDERLMQRILEYGYRRVVMKGDGMCLFRTLSYLIFGVEFSRFFIRDMIMAQLKENKDVYSHLHVFTNIVGTNSENYEEYLERMACPATVGDYLCVQALADLCHIKITIVTSFIDIILLEFVPLDGYYYKEIRCCVTSGPKDMPGHMDALLPLEAF